LNHATLETRFHIENADKVFYLTADQSTTHWIEKLNSTSETLYTFYEPGQERIISYHRMVDRILSCVREGLNVCVVLYGHPGVFAYPTHEAVRRARIEGFKSKMLPAISAEDCLFAEVGVDPGTSGCQSFEATDFLVHKRKFDTSCSLILWQIGVVGQTTYEYQFDMSRIRVLVNYLETYYDPAHEVVIYEAAQYPICDSIIERVPLKRVPESQKINPISTLYVPPTVSPPPDPVMLELLGLCIPEQNC
jgi:uncharacterized protein YabN with tetrapyrrole methylase and pyrophosphatase domain